MTARLLAAGLIEKQIDERELHSNVLTLPKRGQRMLKEIHRQWQPQPARQGDQPNHPTAGQLGADIRAGESGSHAPGVLNCHQAG